MRGPLVVAAVFALGVPSVATAQEAGAAAPKVEAPASGAKVWVRRHAEIQEFLRTAPIERIVKVGEGVTNPDRAFFAAGGLAESALVKVLPPRRQGGYWESYKSEIAAYELDRLLGLDMVPVTVERRIEGLKASVQLWVSDAELLSEVGSRKPTQPLVWAKQVCRQRIFDALTANIDRNAGNMLIDEEWNLILIDHSRAFAGNQTPFLDKINRADREIYDALKALDEATLMERLKPWLFGGKSVRALLERRDKIVGRLDRFVEERGEAGVFVF